MKSSTPLNEITLFHDIAEILRRSGRDECLKMANLLERQAVSSNSLHLRALNLKAVEILEISDALRREKIAGNQTLKSISFSFNPQLGDDGIVYLMQSLPKSICEIGLVDCGIGDKGALAIQSWMRENPQIRMICIEQNEFSAQKRQELRKLSSELPALSCLTL